MRSHGVPDVPQFASIEWRDVKGLGRVATVRCDRERPRADSGLAGADVVIDGDLYKCIRVERFAMGAPISAGEIIGLLVKAKTLPQQS
jgi:hypothetical protein